MNKINLIIDILMLIILTYCAYTDFKFGKIYNKITFPLIIAGLIINIFRGKAFILSALAGAGFCFMAGILFFALQAFGGGDVKLFMAIGALKGIYFTTQVFCLSIVIMAIWGFGAALYKKELLKLLTNLWKTIYSIICSVMYKGVKPVLPTKEKSIRLKSAHTILIAYLIILSKNIY